MNKREYGQSIGEAFKYIDFTAGHSMDALVRLPALVFKSYVHDPLLDRERGQVVRVDNYKYLIQNNGRLNEEPHIENNQVQPSLCKLFRDSSKYDWVREEYCIEGFIRTYNGVDYRCIVQIEDSATPPPNNNSWEVI